MKSTFLLFFLFLLKTSSSQQSFRFTAVDYYVSNVTAKSPDSLANKLTGHYLTEHEKVRAIFKWITNNITYNTSNYRNRRASSESFLEDTDDSGDLKPL
jgi:transglutaminase-like putative cysteine protease